MATPNPPEDQDDDPASASAGPRPAYDEAPPFWTDADPGATALESDGSSEGAPPRADRSSSRGAPRGTRGARGADPLAVIEDVFPGKVMGFTPASAAADGAADPDGGHGAEPESFPDEPDDDD